MQVQAQTSAAPAPTSSIDDPQALVQDNLDSTMTDAAGSGTDVAAEPSEDTTGETEPADETTSEETPAEDGAGEGDTGDSGETTDEPAVSTATSD